MKVAQDKIVKCSFCDRKSTEVETVIQASGKEVYICNRCIELCNQALEEYKKK